MTIGKRPGAGADICAEYSIQGTPLTVRVS